ncbi:MAG: transposase [Herpetosiphon sp.]
MTMSFDPSTIQDLAVRALVVDLMNQLEAIHTKVQEQAAEIQRLRDENNRLRGEQPQPTVLPSRPTRLLSSEQERKVPRPRQKRVKDRTITRTEVVRLDRTQLPPDAQFKGYQRVVVQDIILMTDTVQFLKEKFYAPSTQQSYVAAVPTGFEGQFGPNVKALILTLYFESGLSEPKIRSLLALAGLDLSVGQLSKMLTAGAETFHAERQAILAAGLASSPWQHIDTTATRVDGVNQHCHVVCNPLYTVFMTLPQRDRLAALDALRGAAPRTFRVTPTTWSLLRLMGVPAREQRRLKQLPVGREFTEDELEAYLAQHCPQLASRHRKWIKDALAIAAYHAQDGPTLPIVHTLVCDDAPPFHMLTEGIALCWVHDARHYKRLEPRLPYHQSLLTQFMDRYWDLYRRLLAYRDQPTETAAEQLRQDFDTLFTTVTGYTALDERIQITLLKRQGLLQVLQHPELPLHNNPAELGARQRVRKRDISFGPRSAAGVAAWDTFQTLAATATKLGVNIYHYLRERMCGGDASLAEVVRVQGQAAHFGDSWTTDAPPRPDWKPVPVLCWHR